MKNFESAILYQHSVGTKNLLPVNSKSTLLFKVLELIYFKNTQTKLPEFKIPCSTTHFGQSVSHPRSFRSRCLSKWSFLLFQSYSAPFLLDKDCKLHLVVIEGKEAVFLRQLNTRNLPSMSRLQHFRRRNELLLHISTNYKFLSDLRALLAVAFRPR